MRLPIYWWWPVWFVIVVIVGAIIAVFIFVMKSVTILGSRTGTEMKQSEY